ncbi:hypothetical protein LXL04_017909 [Taraxacum kok-saghyz]
MKTIWEKGDDDDVCGGSCRTSGVVGGGENGGMLEVVGGTKSMSIAGDEECNSSSSSSIGNDSDDDREEDVESRYNDHHNNNGSFDNAIQALEEALPIRRGISSFYNGKSKSFTSLTDVWPSTSSSIQDIAKPENAYTRKRKNLGAFKLSNINTGRISKKPRPTTFQQSQVNRRSFSMVNLHQCNPTKIENC